MKKLEIKLRHFEELEATMDAERQAVSTFYIFKELDIICMHYNKLHCIILHYVTLHNIKIG